MQSVLSFLLLAVSFAPSRTWYATNEPLNIHVNVGEPAALVMTDFVGQNFGAIVAPEVKGDETIDLKKIFPQASTPGTYVLYAVKPNTDPADGFFGTPLVVNVRGDVRRGASPGPMVWRVEPLRYARMETDAGPLTIVLYYNSAPHTVENFLKLAGEGFYDGLTFHRILPNFILQGGDPRGDGTGGPGYAIGAEFNERPHVEGVLSMARQRDPLEPIAKPRAEFADSAGSQFMICLAGGKARSLDRRYTAFGIVVDGLDAVRTMAAIPLSNEQTGRPKQPPIIRKITLHEVTFADNPYKKVLRAPDVIPPEDRPTTAPAAGQ